MTPFQREAEEVSGEIGTRWTESIRLALVAAYNEGIEKAAGVAATEGVERKSEFKGAEDCEAEDCQKVHIEHDYRMVAYNFAAYETAESIRDAIRALGV